LISERKLRWLRLAVCCSVIYSVIVCYALQYYRKARSLALSRTHPELFKEDEGLNDQVCSDFFSFIHKSKQ